MNEWLIEIMEKFGYIGVTLLAALETVFLPLPSELVLTFAGFMTTYTSMNVGLTALFATIGAVSGSLIFYGVGMLLPIEKLELIIEKWGKFMGLKGSDIHKAQAWFNKYGASAVFLCRFVPVVRSIISIPAGMARMPIWKFILFTALGIGTWNTFLVCLGSYAGDNLTKINEYLHLYSGVAIVIMAIFVVVAGTLFIIKRKKSK